MLNKFIRIELYADLSHQVNKKIVSIELINQCDNSEFWRLRQHYRAGCDGEVGGETLRYPASGQTDTVADG